MDGYVTRFQSFTPFRRDCSILRGRARKHKTLSVRRESHSGVDAPSSALKRAVNLVKTCESLIPYSDDSVNLGLLLWCVAFSVSIMLDMARSVLAVVRGSLF